RPLVSSATGGGEAPAVGTEGHTGDPVLVAWQDADRLARINVPDLDGPVLASRGQGMTIGAEGHAGCGFVVGLDPESLPASPNVPDLDDPVTIYGGDVPSIAAKGHIRHAGLVAQGRKIPVAEPPEVVPLPAPQVLRAVVEQLLHPEEVV